MLTVKTILHPTDFSERSHYAFWLACSLARDHGARAREQAWTAPPPSTRWSGCSWTPRGTGTSCWPGEAAARGPGSARCGG